MFILSKVGLNKLNPFTLSQITYGFQKSNQGSKEFWKKAGEHYNNQHHKIDNLGIAIMINSFGRSNEGSISWVLPTFKPIILNQMMTFNQTEALLILSGIASEASMKTKGYLDPALYTSIFEAY